MPGCGSRYCEGETLAAGEVLARLQAMGLDTGTAAPEALPAAKHIFSHIEWHMNGILLHVPPKMPRQAACGQAGKLCRRSIPCPVRLSHIRSLWYEILAFLT